MVSETMASAKDAGCEVGCGVRWGEWWGETRWSGPEWGMGWLRGGVEWGHVAPQPKFECATDSGPKVSVRNSP